MVISRMRALACAPIVAAAMTAGALAQEPSATRFVPVPDNAILSSNLTGLEVDDKAGAKVGEIKDAMIASGRLGGYILSVGGVLGLGSHYVVVSPAGLIVSYDAAKKAWRARIDATKDELKAAPAFAYDGRWAR